MSTEQSKARLPEAVDTTSGVVVLGFGPQPLDFFAKTMKACGKDAIVCPDVARMAGANLAAGSPAALAALRARLAHGAIHAQQKATPGLPEAAVKWLACGERGISSNTLFTRLTGIDAIGRDGSGHPRDPDDLDRCLKLLAALPELREQLPRMSEESPGASGGWQGSIAPANPNALPLGYVDYATDSGHQGSSFLGNAAYDASWALNDPEALANFASLSYPRVAQAAREITRSYYGRAPERAYFEGCSGGGRVALMMAQRFPQLFDGVIAGAPGPNYVGVSLQMQRGAKAMAQPGAELTPGTLALLAKAARDARPGCPMAFS